MKKKRQHKYLLILTLGSLFLLLLPCLLGYGGWWRGGQQEEPPVHRCPTIIEGSLPLQKIKDGEGTVPPGEHRQEGVTGDPSRGPEELPKQHIYLHATWRTGSSFLGELFNQHPDVFYLYEPMWHLWQALYPGDAESLQGALRDMLRSLFLCDFSVLRLYFGPRSQQTNLTTSSLFGWHTNKVICSQPLCPNASHPRARLGLLDGAECRSACPPRPLRELEAECRRYPAVVIKDVRLMDAGVLLPLLRDPALNLRIIQLFRDPRAVHNSRLKSKHALLRESVQVLRSHHREEPLRHLLPPPPGGQGATQPPSEDFVDRALEVICEAWVRDLLLFSSSGPRPPLSEALRRRYTSLRYEDLVREPGQQLARLLHFAGLTPMPELQTLALNLTRGSGYPSDNPFRTSARDAREAIGAWKEGLSRRQVEQVEEVCKGAMTVLSYARSPKERALQTEGPPGSRG
ncbi:carbohydrate sulfotransferase 7-like [Pleurodeles waltl]|uniref:carbohydrate sulfotransferase 7-like n=1 Tax=Pleurodeles waltl TaxID=8319 RepID=UPI003709A539